LRISEDLLSAPQASSDKLDRLREVVREVRDRRAEVAELQERIEQHEKRLSFLLTKELVDMFTEAQVPEIVLGAEGNWPAYRATKVPYYKANISTEWPEDRQLRGFYELEKHGGDALVRTQVIVDLPRGKGQRARAKTLLRYLNRYKFDHSQRLSVPWNTLTAWLREQYTKFPNDPKPDLEAIGAHVGEVVRLTEEKVK
jgi:hypothetical protein